MAHLGIAQQSVTVRAIPYRVMLQARLENLALLLVVGCLDKHLLKILNKIKPLSGVLLSYIAAREVGISCFLARYS